MKRIILIVSLVVIGCASQEKNKGENFKTHPLSIVQGVTTDKETVLSVLLHQKNNQEQMNLDFVYGLADSEESAKTFKAIPYAEDSSPNKVYKLLKFHFQNLEKGKDYFFRALKDGEVYDERNFTTLDLKKTQPKIGIASCSDDTSPVKTEMWKAFLNQSTDINFFIGDNSYADKLNGKWGIPADKSQMWQRYAETWEKLFYYHSSSLTPTLYVWDDHDFGLNDGGRDFKFKKEALEVFKAFYPLKEVRGVYSFTYGAGSLFKAFNQNFLFLDGRYFRSKKTDNKNQTHWGKSQEKVVYNTLKSGVFTWLIQGDQYFGGHHAFESYEGQRPDSFKKTLQQLRRSKSKVVFISGDRHLTEIMKIDKKVLGYETYELTSSGIHAKVFPGAYERDPNPRLVVGRSGEYNFMVVQPQLDKTKMQLSVKSHGLKNKLHFERQLQIDL